MNDCIGSQIVERTFIAQGEDGSILFLPLDGYRMIVLDPEP